jgi:hypothetical protein
MAKRKILAVKVSEDTLRDFGIAAGVRGSTMSALVTQFVLKTIREAKEENPSAFPDFEDKPAKEAESEVDRMLYEAFDGREITPELRARMINLMKAALSVQDAAEKNSV